MTDHEIIDLFWERSENAILAASKKFGSYCRTIAFNILGNHEDAEECVNDTLLRAWKSIPPNRPKRLHAFLGKISRNLALDRYKQNTAQKRGLGQLPLVLDELEYCLPSSETVAAALDEQELIQCLNRFLNDQPTAKRRLFILRYWYAQPIKAIAEQMAYSESKVTSLLFRMRSELKARIEEDGGIG